MDLAAVVAGGETVCPLTSLTHFRVIDLVIQPQVCVCTIKSIITLGLGSPELHLLPRLYLVPAEYSYNKIILQSFNFIILIICFPD